MERKRVHRWDSSNPSRWETLSSSISMSFDLDIALLIIVCILIRSNSITGMIGDDEVV